MLYFITLPIDLMTIIPPYQCIWKGRLTDVATNLNFTKSNVKVVPLHSSARWVSEGSMWPLRNPGSFHLVAPSFHRASQFCIFSQSMGERESRKLHIGKIYRPSQYLHQQFMAFNQSSAYTQWREMLRNRLQLPRRKKGRVEQTIT